MPGWGMGRVILCGGRWLRVETGKTNGIHLFYPFLYLLFIRGRGILLAGH